MFQWFIFTQIKVSLELSYKSLNVCSGQACMICFYWLLGYDSLFQDGYDSLKEFQYKQGHFELLCFVEVRLSYFIYLTLRS